ncbi:MalM family protein [Escherichia coli]|uniref:MalM family protein n=1 Tax=Escherichia coli TaxID=562 RepID=UPI0038B6A920
MQKMILLAFSLLWLVGCAQPVSSLRGTSDIPPVSCCTSLEQLPAQSFNSKSSLTLNFGARTPLIDDANCRARAQVVALPDFNGTYTLELTIPLDDQRFLAAQAVIYDADWKPLQKLSYPDFEYRKPVLLQSHRLFASILVQSGINTPRWLVISTIAQPQPDKLKLIAASEIYAERTQVEAPLELTRYATACEDGTINVRISRFPQLANELINAVTGG